MAKGLAKRQALTDKNLSRLGGVVLRSDFYADLQQMADEASALLHRFEAGRSNTEVFDALRSIGVACLDGDKLNASIRSDLGPRRTLNFQRAVFSLSGVNTLSVRPGGNQSITDSLFNINKVAGELKTEAEAKDQELAAVHDRNPPDGDRQFDYVHATRINELQALPSTNLDATRLIRLLQELNAVHAASCHMATAMLVRAITDHIPPVFGMRNFGEVASNYSGGSSFKGSMQHLQHSLRNIADAHLHVQMRRSEVLPTEHQVDFRSDLDVLIGEVVRLLRMSP